MKLAALHQCVNYRCLVLAALFMSLTACGTLDRMQGSLGGVETTKLTKFKPTAQFNIRWHANLGRAETNLLKPAISLDAIYGASEQGVLSRVDKQNGKVLWRVEINKTLSGGVGYGNGLVLVGTSKGEVLAYDESGKLVWQTQVSSEVLNAPQVSDTVVLVRTSDGRVTGLNSADGSKVWSYERRTPALVVRNHAGVAIQRGIAYAGFAGGKLAALEAATGKILWEATVSTPKGNTELERISDITSTPVVDDEEVCAISFQGRLSCFQIVQGSPLWSRDVESDKGMMLLRSYLYVTDSNGVVYVLDKETGSSLWKNEQFKKRNTSAPYVYGNYVIVGDYDGYVHALNREDGSMAARIRLEASDILAQVQENDQGLIVLTRSGGLYSLSIQ